MSFRKVFRRGTQHRGESGSDEGAVHAGSEKQRNKVSNERRISRRNGLSFLKEDLIYDGSKWENDERAARGAQT